MRIKLLLAMVMLFAIDAHHLLSQSRPSAVSSSIPLTVGLGVSDFNSDWLGRIGGPTLWIDWRLSQLPSRLSGLGIEAEARDLNYLRTSALTRLRYDTAVGGATYTFGHGRSIRPFGKFLMGVGSIDFPPPLRTSYSHDTRTIYEFGGGATYRLHEAISIRGVYDYQLWPDFFHHHALAPNGTTIGATYDFGRNPQSLR